MSFTSPILTSPLSINSPQLSRLPNPYDEPPAVFALALHNALPVQSRAAAFANTPPTQFARNGIAAPSRRQLLSQPQKPRHPNFAYAPINTSPAPFLGTRGRHRHHRQGCCGAFQKPVFLFSRIGTVTLSDKGSRSAGHPCVDFSFQTSR